MALINTKEEIKEYCAGITNAVSIEAIMPSVKAIQRKVLLPDYLGKELMDDLEAAIESNSLSSEQEDLLHQVRNALAPLAVAHYMSATLSEIGDSGPREVNSENAIGARLWVFNKQTASFIEDGEQALSDLLDYLEDNYTNNTLWNQSKAFTGLHECLINSTKEFNRHVFINRSHQFFKSIQAVIRIIERTILRKKISKAFYEHLLAAQQGNSATEEEREAIELANRSVAHLAIAYCKLPIMLGNDGAVQLTPDNRQSDQRVALTSPSGFDADKYKAEMLDEGRKYLLDLRKYLDENSSDTVMQLYYNSGLRQNPASSGYSNPAIDNSNFIGVYAL